MMFIKSIASWFAAALLLVSSAQSFGSTVDDLPGIPGISPPGNPAFVNDVTVGLSPWRDGFKLTVSEIGEKPFVFKLLSDEYKIFDGSYRLTAYFDQDGILDTAKSNVQIRGMFNDEALDALSGTGRQHELWGGNLFSARIDDVGLSFKDGKLALGFSTTDFGGWAAQFGTDESVWLYGFHPSAKHLLPFLIALNDGSLKATAITTVPLPSGIWLIGSALMGYGLIGRRRDAVPAAKDGALA